MELSDANLVFFLERIVNLCVNNIIKEFFF